MIQRKQTLWLLLVLLSMVASAFIPFSSFTTISTPTISTLNTSYLKADYNMFTIIFTAVIIAIAGFAIFLFKNRPLQKILCLIGILVNIGFTMYEFFVGNIPYIHRVLTFGFALPILSIFFFILAWNGIRADQQLIKSVDRLRD